MDTKLAKFLGKNESTKSKFLYWNSEKNVLNLSRVNCGMLRWFYNFNIYLGLGKPLFWLTFLANFEFKGTYVTSYYLIKFCICK